MNADIQPFRVNENLVRTLIKKQAGSLQKAILECLCNGADAGADRIDVEFGEDMRSLVIRDNGRGFASREEIDKHFGEFAFGHDSAEEKAYGRVYGTFGLGRGQIMSFGETTWRTNGFQMEVVGVEAKEGVPGYRVSEVEGEPLRGCRIEIRLHEPVSYVAQGYTIDAIKRQMRYSPVAIYVDGGRINVDPAGLKWAEETDDFWFSVDQNGQTGVDVYNMGAFVRTYPHQKVGVSGELISKVGHAFDLNMARNDILQPSCALLEEGGGPVLEIQR